ncbi:DUF5682 family protein, partial [Streptomyces gardneri]|uniref:DUF5682 family protein n=1 Tax=Streptomyces gardneri TaxID=66892 RepID=UPI0033CF0ACF
MAALRADHEVVHLVRVLAGALGTRGNVLDHSPRIGVGLHRRWGRSPACGKREVPVHRLRLLGVDWGTPAPGRAGTGTFRETWRLGW